MKKKFIEASELPEGERVYLRKSFGGWWIVHPIKNEDGSFNKINLLFGGKTNLIRLTVYLVIILLIVYGVNEIVAQYKDFAKNPCNYCPGYVLDNNFDFGTDIKVNLGGDNG